MSNGNLIPFNERTEDEQRTIQRMGGKASGKARRDKRNFRETITTLLSMPDMDKNGKQLISPITGKPMSIRENIVMQALLQARKGNIKALQTILDIMGERTFKLEGDVKLKSSRYETMTDEEMREEALRISESITNY